MAKVSVIVTTYNQGKYLKTAVDSVVESTFKDVEIILIDDGSTDLITLKEIEKINYSNVKKIFIPNQGVCVARNIAIQQATGEFILPLDGDDYISNTFIEEAERVLNTYTNVKVVTSKVQFFEKLKSEFILPTYSFDLLKKQNLFVITSMFRKSDFIACGGFNTTMNKGLEDWDFWIKFLKNGGDVYHIPKIHFYYRIKNFSRNSFINNLELIRLQKQIYINHPDVFLTNFNDPTKSFKYKFLLLFEIFHLTILLKYIRLIHYYIDLKLRYFKNQR